MSARHPACPPAATRTQADTRRADTTALGYDTQWLCLRASDAGACHRRDRLFALAWQPSARSRLGRAARSLPALALAFRRR